MDARIKPYLPDYVNLYYVDYRDDLQEHLDLLQECLTNNNECPLSEAIFDWWDYPEGDYIREIEAGMEDDNIENWSQIIEDNLDEIREYLWDKDVSTPERDLLRNTGHVSLFYSLGEDIDCGWHEAFLAQPWKNQSEEASAWQICRKLGIKKGTKEYDIVMEMVQEAHYGGELRIYWEGDIEDLLTYDNDNDFQSIRFKGQFCVAIYNSNSGSGWYDYLTLDLELPFIRQNLFVSASDRYSIEDCFGTCGNVGKDCAEPILSKDKPKSKKKLQVSPAALRLSQEQEYIKTFKAGGCTLGDTNMKRHRNTYYDNNIPCGIHCPHCGQFWID